MKPIRVFGVDDHPVVRHGLAAMLAGERDMQWVGEAADGAEALQAAAPLQPDVVLMDLVMPRMGGLAAITALRPLLPATRFVVLTEATEHEDVRRALAAGASGLLLKNATAQDLIGAIHAAHRGLVMPLPGGDDAAPQRPAAPSLTQRERELLVLMARGLPNLHISQQLGIAMPTVKFHVTNILTKLHADNRTEAVLIALRQRIVRLE